MKIKESKLNKKDKVATKKEMKEAIKKVSKEFGDVIKELSKE